MFGFTCTANLYFRGVVGLIVFLSSVTHERPLTVATYEGRDYARARSALRIGGERVSFHHRASFG